MLSSTDSKEKEIKWDWILKGLEKDDCKLLWENIQRMGNEFGHCVPIGCHRLCYHNAILEYYQKYPEKCRERMILEVTRQIEKCKSDQDKLKNMSIECLKKGIAQYSYFGLSEFFRTVEYHLLKPDDSLENSTIKKCSSETKFAPQGILLENGDFYVNYDAVSVYQQNYGAHSHNKEICLNGVHVPPNKHVRLLHGVNDFCVTNEQVAPFECIMKKDNMTYIIHDNTGPSGRTGYKKSTTL